MKNNNGNSAENIEIAISRILQAGVFISAFIILLGLAAFFAVGSGYAGGVFPTDFIEVIQGALAFRPYAVMLLGLLVLILTPIIRVGVSIILFLKQKDLLYTGITSLVFVILIASLFFGKSSV